MYICLGLASCDVVVVCNCCINNSSETLEYLTPLHSQVDWSVMGRKGTEPGFLMNPTGIAGETRNSIQICLPDEI